MDVITDFPVRDASLRSKEAEKKEGIILATTTLAEVKTPNGEYVFKISKVKDKDGKEIYVSRLSKKGEDSLFTDDSEKELILDFDQKKRLLFCSEKLNFPFQVATHLALNRPEVDLEKLTPSTLTKVLMKIKGPPDAGKTAHMSALVVHGWPVFDMDRFAGRGIKEYTGDAIGFGSSKPPLIERFKEGIKKAIDQSLSKKMGSKKTMFETFDTLTSVALSSGKSVILIDTPGYSREAREPDVFDLVTEQGIDGSIPIPERFNWDDPSDWERVYKFAKEFPNEDVKKLERKARQTYELVRTAVINKLRPQS